MEWMGVFAVMRLLMGVSCTMLDIFMGQILGDDDALNRWVISKMKWQHYLIVNRLTL